MKITEERHGDVVVLTVEMSYENLACPDRLLLRPRVQNLVDQGRRALVIDLGSVTAMTDGDLAQVVVGLTIADKAGARTAIVRPPQPSDARRFMSTAFRDAFSHMSFDTLDVALEFLAD